ncbi:MAG: hypothetical protein M3N26_12170 [Pseudomonadota bacterium]|nr:hypothetical protein [Pseudomonadota bacterium]
MPSPLPLPDWLPWWVHLAILLALLFVALMLVMMPFSVFGTKTRLEAIEARLDEIQGEIRSLALRLPEAVPGDDDDEFGPMSRATRRMANARPPIPPAPTYGARAAAPSRPARTEPRLY